MRSMITALATLALATSALGVDRLEPVRIINPPEDGTLIDPDFEGPRVQTFTRDTAGVPFRVFLGSVPEEGPARFGVSPDARDTLIGVRTREPLPPLVITPFQEIDRATRDEIRRSFPYVRRVDTVTDDLRRAQREFLRDSGLILTVRTFRSEPRQQSRATEAPRPARVLRPDEEIDATPTRVLPPSEPAPEEKAQSPE